jgi:ribonucleoside-diphosphate reductase subunit M2
MKMGDSPAKKLDFTEANKENIANDEVAVPIKGIPVMDEPEVEVVADKAAVASTIKPEEAGEPLLQENPQRFVLFPIKYHEVSVS